MKERQLGLALAAQDGQVDFDAADVARLGECDRLRLDRLRREDASARIAAPRGRSSLSSSAPGAGRTVPASV